MTFLRRRQTAGLAAIVLIAAGCSPAVGGSAGASAITGGAATSAFPAVAAVGVVDAAGKVTYRCTASLIAPDAALTAAHCLPATPDTVRLLFGSDVGAPSRTVSLRDQLIHPLWVGSGNPPLGVGQANDLALLLLDDAITDIEPVPLLRPSDLLEALQVERELLLVGFGAQQVGGPSGVKRVTTARLAQVGNYELRVGLADDGQACDGDSGGPALAEVGELLFAAGLVSRTVPSATETCDGGAIYTRIDAYLSFIQDSVLLPCGSGPVAPCLDGSTGVADAGSDSATAADAGKDSTAAGGGTPGTSNPAIRPQKDSGCVLSNGPIDLELVTVLLALLLWRRLTG